jgi:LuxR family quorum sensing-dependent transcriptional regulator
MAMTAQPFGREAFEFIEDLDRLSSAAAVMERMDRAVSRFGFENLIVTGLSPQPDQSFDDLVLATRWPAEFHALYVSSLRQRRSKHSPRPSFVPPLRMRRAGLW